MGPRLVRLAALAPAVLIGAGGWAHRWAAEDAYIDFRIVDNILAGHGPVFNVGERVEVYTDALWVALLAFVHLVVPASLAWESVVLGLVCSVAGVVLAGRGTQRLAAHLGRPTAVPVGLLAVCSIASVWDFATSGLETGLLFAWLGASWWSVVGVLDRHRSAVPAAVVCGLGPLIRPDMAIIAGALILGLVVVGLPAATGERPPLRRAAGLIGVAVAPPLAYELFRAAYFGMLVPNTALAKSASSLWLDQGARYLSDLSGTYHLPLLALALLPLLACNLLASLQAGRQPFALALAPVVGGALSMAYVVAIGGDFMRARLLLPGLFALTMAVWAQVPAGATASALLPAVAALAVGVWSVASITVVRSPLVLSAGGAKTHGIIDERLYWVWASGRPHPVTIDEYQHEISVRLAAVVEQVEATLPTAGRATAIDLSSDVTVAHPPLLPTGAAAPPGRMVVDEANIGLFGVVVGPSVYVADILSLGDPVGSHTVVVKRTRPGHEKLITTAWAVARFGSPDVASSPALATYGLGATAVIDARRAMACDPLRSYLEAVTTPLTFGGALRDLVHSPRWTTMKFSSDPVVAERQLCG